VFSYFPRFGAFFVGFSNIIFGDFSIVPLEGDEVEGYLLEGWLSVTSSMVGLGGF